MQVQNFEDDNQDKVVTRSRGYVDLVAVVAGITITQASMFLFVSLMAALGFWTYRPEELATIDSEFGVVSSVGWSLSAGLGAWCASVMARSQNLKESLSNAITSWAGSYLLFGGIALTIADSNLKNLLGEPTIGFFWHGFAGDLAALLASVAGGVLANHFEQKNFKKNENLHHRPDSKKSVAKIS